MPYENEHACRLKEPGLFKRFARKTLKHNGKEYDVIIGFKEGGGSEAQAFRYPKDSWSEKEAQAHCKDHDGRFEAAKKCNSCEVEMKKIIPDEVIEIKNFSFELKDMDEKGQFTGMLSTNGHIDPVRDRFNDGTWKKTIMDRGDKPFPWLWAHDRTTPIGSWKPKDIPEGLLIETGRLNLETLANGNAMVPKAYEAYALYKKKDIDGVSVGFRPIPAKTKYVNVNGETVRDIFEAQLIEGSMTPLPMNIQASITNIKSWNDLFAIIVKNLNDVDLKYKIFSLYGYSPEALSTLEPVTTTLEPEITSTNTEKSDDDNIDWGEVYKLLPPQIKRYGGK